MFEKLPMGRVVGEAKKGPLDKKRMTGLVKVN
jgi:hypothetical protein